VKADQRCSWGDISGKRIIVLCLRWYLRYPLSYRDLEEMMAERGLSVDHSTIARWVLHYSPVLNERIRYQMRNRNRSWRVDETTSASRVAGRTCIGRFAPACALPTKTLRAWRSVFSQLVDVGTVPMKQPSDPPRSRNLRRGYVSS